MSSKELNHLLVIEKCARKALSQIEWAQLLGISLRQLQRQHQGYRTPTSLFRRAIQALDIKLILAKSPQAKERVERANQTLQDRLVKALRLANISSIEQENAFLPQFIASFNSRFAKQPQKQENLHRPVRQSSEELDAILSLQTKRKLNIT